MFLSVNIQMPNADTGKIQHTNTLKGIQNSGLHMHIQHNYNEAEPMLFLAKKLLLFLISLSTSELGYIKMIGHDCSNPLIVFGVYVICLD